MVQKVKNRKLNMPMLEIIITLGILTIVSVFLMQLFLGANSLETKAKDTSKASILAENVAETLKATDAYEKTVTDLGLKKLYEERNKETFEKYYDSQWKEQQEPATYTMQVIIKRIFYDGGIVYENHITVRKDKPYAVIKEDQEPLADITCKSYRSKVSEDASEERGESYAQ